MASNEFEEAWLDEGFTSYSTGQAMELAFGTGSTLIDLPLFKVSERDLLRLTNSPEHRFDRVRQPAWTYSPGEYPFYAYEKPELLLRTLERMLGRQTMARVMRTYQERWRYRHPSSDDFYAVASEVSNRDLRAYFSQLVDAAGIVDYEVSSLTSQPLGRASAGTVGRTAPPSRRARHRMALQSRHQTTRRCHAPGAAAALRMRTASVSASPGTAAIAGRPSRARGPPPSPRRSSTLTMCCRWTRTC